MISSLSVLQLFKSLHPGQTFVSIRARSSKPLLRSSEGKKLNNNLSSLVLIIVHLPELSHIVGKWVIRVGG